MKDIRLKALKEIEKATQNHSQLPYRNDYLNNCKHCSLPLFQELEYDGYIDFYYEGKDGYFDISGKGRDYIFEHSHLINSNRIAIAALVISVIALLVSIFLK